MVQFEVCCYSLHSCMVASTSAHVSRIELCSSPPSGGLTPSTGLVQLVQSRTSLPISVMIRPRGGDFLYSSLEFEVMRSDILSLKSHLSVEKGDGFVLGLLRKDGTVDIERTKELVELARPFPVTFHRAIDMSSDHLQALEAIIASGCRRILSSGQSPTAAEGIDVLRSLVDGARGRIEIMAGAGVNGRNVEEIVRTGVDAVHASASVTVESGMEFRQAKVGMASKGEVDEWTWSEAGAEKIEAIGRAIFEVSTETYQSQ
ncbi:CutC family protein [Atractiella rhizophila]|nr:CutC family protein [Atractiella rhizophila]